MGPPKKDEMHLQQISIDDVKVGMYVEEILERDGRLVVSENLTIVSTQQIEVLKKRGIKSVRINTQKAVADLSLEDTDPDSEESIRKREEEYYQELDTAVNVHHEGVIRVSEVLQAIRDGNPFSLSIIKSAAEDIVESIQRNPDALISLSQLKGYDNYTYVHSVNVAILVSSMAKSMGYSKDSLVELGVGGLLHDIGKMRVPDKILNKPGKLTDTEFAIVKRHPEFGVETILDKRGISDIARKIVLQHHERYNGKGYPLGLKGERIHEVGLIAAVADVYDALTSDRVYKTAWTPQKALALIFQGSDKEYSRRVVELCTRHLGIYPVGSFVKLVSGELGVVIRMDRGKLLSPVILILFDKNNTRMKKPYKIDLWQKQKEDDGEQYKIEISLNPKAFDVTVGDYIQKRF